MDDLIFVLRYQENRRLIGGNKRAIMLGACSMTSEDILKESIARNEMVQARNYIRNLKDSNIKLFLHFRYIRGLTMEATAEAMEVSRRTAFRISKSVLKGIV
jgi:DNA-directed RNA polymerase specialized sigma subunit